METITSDKFKYKSLLITGGAGFIGSNLAVAFKRRYPALNVIALDNLKRRGSELNLPRLKDAGVGFVHGDIRNREDLESIYEVDALIEASAEPAVMAGYHESPRYLIHTNLIGTINCLELARRAQADIIFLSTSRVYPYTTINDLRVAEKATRYEWQADQKVAGWSLQGFDSDFSLQGSRSLYGATKLCSEVLLQEYLVMYGLRGIVNRCSIIAGPWQFGKVDQGVFSLWVLSHYFQRKLNYIGFDGQGKQVRDLLHVDDLFELIRRQFELMKTTSGRIYNVGGGVDNTLSLLEATGICQQLSGNRIEIGSLAQNRPADISIYISDNRQVTRDVAWKPQKNCMQILEDIFSWLKTHEDDVYKSIVV